MKKELQGATVASTSQPISQKAETNTGTTEKTSSAQVSPQNTEPVKPKKLLDDSYTKTVSVLDNDEDF